MNTLKDFDTPDNDVGYVRRGKVTMFFNLQIGYVCEIHAGRRLIRERDKINAYLAAHKPLRDFAATELAKRREAVRDWRATTPCARYSADRGLLRLKIGSTFIGVRNGTGDVTNAPIYLCDNGPIPPEFRFVLAIEGEATVMDYDCEGATEAATIRNADIYIGDEGAIAVVNR